MKHSKRFPLIAVVAISVQFLLGMFANMYATFPEDANVTAYWESARNDPVVLAHILLGIALFLGATRYFVTLWVNKQKVLLPYAGIGLAAITIAAIGGERFVSTQDDLWSFVMAVGFLASIITYLAAYFVTRNSKV